MKDIKVKWWSEKFRIGVTENKEVMRINLDNTITILKREFSYNRNVYRARGENKKIGEKSLSKSLVKQEKIIQEYLPF